MQLYEYENTFVTDGTFGSWALGILLTALALVVWAVIASIRHQQKLEARIQQLLTLPNAQVCVWVEERLVEWDMGTYLQYRLFASVNDGEVITVATQDGDMRFVCARIEAAGRHVQNVPSHWRE